MIDQKNLFGQKIQHFMCAYWIEADTSYDSITIQFTLLKQEHTHTHPTNQ